MNALPRGGTRAAPPLKEVTTEVQTLLRNKTNKCLPLLCLSCPPHPSGFLASTSTLPHHSTPSLPPSPCTTTHLIDALPPCLPLPMAPEAPRIDSVCGGGSSAQPVYPLALMVDFMLAKHCCKPVAGC